MIKTFTQNDLIRYIYHETTEEETKEIDKALLCDSELQGQYHDLAATAAQLNSASMQPSAATLTAILQHARESVRASRGVE